MVDTETGEFTEKKLVQLTDPIESCPLPAVLRDPRQATIVAPGLTTGDGHTGSDKKGGILILFARGIVTTPASRKMRAMPAMSLANSLLQSASMRDLYQSLPTTMKAS